MSESTMARDRATVKAELEAAEAERATATGRAKAEQPTPDLAKQLADSVAQVKAAKRTKKA